MLSEEHRAKPKDPVALRRLDGFSVADQCVTILFIRLDSYNALVRYQSVYSSMVMLLLHVCLFDGDNFVVVLGVLIHFELHLDLFTEAFHL